MKVKGNPKLGLYPPSHSYHHYHEARDSHRLTIGSVEALVAPVGCKPLIWCCAIVTPPKAPPLDVTNDDAEADIAGTPFVLVGPEAAWPVWPSTGFLERWRPLLMCLSQYFWSGTASLEHRHFFPSVRRHLPGSGSMLPEYPRWKEPHPSTILQGMTRQHDQDSQIRRKIMHKCRDTLQIQTAHLRYAIQSALTL